MQLQEGLDAMQAAGVKLFALSYDEADALQDFRDAHGITYPLLSDPDSQVIRQFGILNTLIDENDHPWFGIPYPGAYVINAAGEITHKFFENNLAVRAGPEQLLRAATGQITQQDTQGEVAAQATPTGNDNAPAQTSAEIFLDGEAVTATVQRDLVARLHVPNGRHAYAQPAPDGSVGLQLSLDSDPALVIRDATYPASETHTLTSTRETFEVHHGDIEVRLPVTVNGNTGDTVKLTGTLRWQTCDDQLCDIPAQHAFELEVPVSKHLPSALGASAEVLSLEPNAMAHFRKMTERRNND